MIKMKICFSALLLGILISCTSGNNADSGGILAGNIQEFNQAVGQAKPGTIIRLANGIWKDAELLFEGKGNKENPIIVAAQEKGKVFLEGNSSLRLAGEHLEVSGLVFRNGYSPTGEVISFRKDEAHLANNCRVTECVIDNFNNPERFESDVWIAMYGKNNQVDHNTLIGKKNQGVTLMVNLDTEASRENSHRIGHNYFGPRPTLGSNGGETLRIGSSHSALFYSNSIVEKNFFERCNGEVETISNKSCGNIYRDNVLFECEGALALRHGNEVLVENNYFLGNGKPNTGGVRVINEKQKVVNNYFYELTGSRFVGALVIMNGVPNSPPMRYVQVQDSEIKGNIFINCDHVELCTGSDQERTATPQNTVIANNIFYSDKAEKMFKVFDDISGISFSGNIVNEKINTVNNNGFTINTMDIRKNGDGLSTPKDKVLKEIGFKNIELPVTKETAGATWYKPAEVKEDFRSGKTIPVKEGVNTLFDAVQNSEPGDILELENGGDYLLTKDIDVTIPITIQTKDFSGSKATVKSERPSFFNIEKGGSLELVNLQIDGGSSPDHRGNCVIRSSKYAMSHNYKVFIKNCTVQNLDVNHSFDVLRSYKHTFADTVLIENSTFEQITGSVASFDNEQEDYGIYNVEVVLLKENVFKDIGGPVLNVYRGGTDESTYGPIIRIQDSELYNVGNAERNSLEASIRMHGVRNALVENCSFHDSQPVNLYLSNGDPVTVLRGLDFHQPKGIVSNSDQYKTGNINYHGNDRF